MSFVNKSTRPKVTSRKDRKKFFKKILQKPSVLTALTRIYRQRDNEKREDIMEAKGKEW